MKTRQWPGKRSVASSSLRVPTNQCDVGVCDGAAKMPRQAKRKMLPPCTGRSGGGGERAGRQAAETAGWALNTRFCPASPPSYWQKHPTPERARPCMHSAGYSACAEAVTGNLPDLDCPDTVLERRAGPFAPGHHCGARQAEAARLLVGPHLAPGQVPGHHQHHPAQPAGLPLQAH